eukprot:g26024.t1
MGICSSRSSDPLGTEKGEKTEESTTAEAPKALKAANEGKAEEEEDDDEDALDEKEAKASPAVPSTQAPKNEIVVTRKAIRKMPAAEQERFVAALKHMMKNTNGPGTSPFYTLAGYHGWPSQFCHHGKESFPAWHRAFLVTFERELIKADKALGKDGNIGLPYWDWSDYSVPFMPEIIAKEFPSLPADFAPPDSRFAKEGIGMFRRYPDSRVLSNARSARIAEEANESLLTEQHFLHASTQNSGNNIESPHNSVHVAIGRPMSSVAWAAFDPMFWLHHCNIDRLYHKYLSLQPDSTQEFRDTQAMMESSGQDNLFTEPLRPFKHPFTGQDFMCAETFTTEPLGYKYDVLPPNPVMQMTEKPTYAIFEDIVIMKMNLKSYMVHVFIKKKGSTLDVPEDEEKWSDMDEHAGMAALFGGKEGCENCVARDPFRIQIKLNKAMQRMKLSRYEIDLHVVCVDEEGKKFALSDTPLPQPKISGPLFFDREAIMEKVNEKPIDLNQLVEWMPMSSDMQS